MVSQHCQKQPDNQTQVLQATGQFGFLKWQEHARGTVVRCCSIHNETMKHLTWSWHVFRITKRHSKILRSQASTSIFFCACLKGFLPSDVGQFKTCPILLGFFVKFDTPVRPYVSRLSFGSALSLSSSISRSCRKMEKVQ